MADEKTLIKDGTENKAIIKGGTNIKDGVDSESIIKKVDYEDAIIKEGVFSLHYFESSFEKEMQSYHEIDLGELNFINTLTNFFKKSEPANTRPGTYSEIEWKTWQYHLEQGLAIPALPILNNQEIKDREINDYETIDQVIADHKLIFPILLKRGYFLYGTQVAHLIKSVIPPIEHSDFEYFFAVKLYYVSRKLTLISPFLEFQLQKFLDSGKSAVDFKRFVKLSLREYNTLLDFSKESVETVEEWLDSVDIVNGKKMKPRVKTEGENAKLIAITIKSMLNVNQGSYIISKQKQTCEAFETLTGYSANSLENLVSRLDPNSTQIENFTSKHFNQARDFLRSTIHQLDNLKSSTSLKN